MKKKYIPFLIVALVLVIISSKLCFNYIYNEKVIEAYEEGNYRANNSALRLFNFFQPYILYYNAGNIAYQNHDYTTSVRNYEKALKMLPGKYKECDIRVNLVLARLSRYDWDEDSGIDADLLLQDLYECRDILLEDGCAKDEEKGHDEEAQRLKEEIDELIKMLENSSGQGGSGSSSGSGQGQNQNDTSREDDIRNRLQEQQSGANEERSKNLQAIEEYDEDMNFNWNGTIW